MQVKEDCIEWTPEHRREAWQRSHHQDIAPKLNINQNVINKRPQENTATKLHQSMVPTVIPWHLPFHAQEHVHIQALKASKPEATKRRIRAAGALTVKNTKMKNQEHPVLEQKGTES